MENREAPERRRARNIHFDDDAIAEDVCNAIFNADVDAAEVEVAVEEGVVTLRGEVSDATSRHHLEQLLFDVPGVRGVACELRVVPHPASYSDPPLTEPEETSTSRLLRGAT